jgi:hypothetical protein
MYVYKPSLELLSYLGVSSVQELPQFESIRKTLTEKMVSGEHTHDNN